MKPTSSTKRSRSDDAPPVSSTDLRRAKLRVGGKDVGADEFKSALQSVLGKQRISIMLDSSIIAYYKAKAGDRGGYQTMINQALHHAMQGEQIESTLRRVIREELGS